MVRAVDKALDKGINVFDTAPIYGLGYSEELLGRVLGSRRKDVVIATKAGLVWEKDGAFNKRVDNSPARIEKEIDASLRRLKTDYIDIYQIHWPDPSTPIEDTLFAMENLKKAGKIRCIGCCNFSLYLLKESLKYGAIRTIQIPFNLIDRSVERDLMPFCRQNGIGVLAYSPMARGLLAGRYDRSTRFEIDDHRSRNGDAYFHGEAFLRNLKVLEKVKSVAKRMNRTPGQIALRWVLENPCVTTAIFGAKNSAQVEENVEALDFVLPREDIEFLNNEI